MKNFKGAYLALAILAVATILFLCFPNSRGLVLFILYLFSAVSIVFTFLIVWTNREDIIKLIKKILKKGAKND